MIPADFKEQRTIFVIMPFAQTPTRQAARLDSFFQHNLKAPIEAADLAHRYRVQRSGQAFNITDEVIRDLFRADVVIADLSGIQPNANVMYELGVRLALSSAPVILIREAHEDNQNVFDISAYFIHPYDPLDYKSLESHLIEKLRRLESAEEPYESPVHRALRGELSIQRAGLAALSPAEQRSVVLNGVRSVEAAVARALGPAGTALAVVRGFGEPAVVRAGDAIANGMHSPNVYEQQGIEWMRRTAEQVRRTAGDGTKISILLASGLMHAGAEALAEGRLARGVLNGMEAAVIAAVKMLRAGSEDAREKLVEVARTATRDPEAGQRAVEVACLLQPDDVLDVETVEDGRLTGLDVRVAEGMQYDSGFASADFAFGPGAGQVVLDNCFLLLCPNQVREIDGLVPLLRAVERTGRPLLIVTDAMYPDVLGTLLVNSHTGRLRCVVAGRPGHGWQQDQLDDLAVATGGMVIAEQRGIPLSEARIEMLGQADQVVVTSTTTRVIGGRGDPARVRQRADTLLVEVRRGWIEYEEIRRRERVARLVGKVVTVAVGGQTPQEARERRYTFESAIRSVQAALRSGCVAGGGAAFLTVRERLRELRSDNPDMEAGIRAVLHALEQPIRRIAESVQRNPEGLEVLTTAPGTGVEVESGTVTDMAAAGVVDASSVLEAALDTALIHARQFLNTSAWSIEPSAARGSI